MLFYVPCFLPKVLHKFQGPTGTQHCSHPKVLPGHPTVPILEYCRISHYSHHELLAFVACGVSFVFPNQRTLVILHNPVQDLQNAVQLLQNASWMKLSDIFLIIRLRISERKTREVKCHSYHILLSGQMILRLSAIVIWQPHRGSVCYSFPFSFTLYSMCSRGLKNIKLCLC